jgi:glycosyltransferase involved in cell wall biosynthesis
MAGGKRYITPSTCTTRSDGKKMTSVKPDTRQPLVSVIMNCLNCERYVREAIDSVYAQTYGNWEIIFWDDASTDGSSRIAKGYDDRLRYFCSKEIVSLGAARNLALSQAKGEFIAFLDCDDLFLPQKLEKQIPLFADPEVGLVFCDSIFFNDKGHTERFYSRSRYWTGRCFSELLTDYFLSLETVIIRRAALDSLPSWFDPGFNIIEEADLFIRLAYQWKLAVVDEPLAKWRVHSESLSWTKRELFAEETATMLNKFEKIIPDFSRKFAVEIGQLRQKIAFQKAVILWKIGNSRAARQCLAPFKSGAARTFFLYYATFFPADFISPLAFLFKKSKITP